MEENSKIKSAYIIKYFPTKLDFNNQHNSYNFEGFREIENLNIGELDLNAKLTCGSGWEVWCSWEENHIAQGSCFQNGHLYLKEVTICYNSPYDQTIEEYPINGGDTGGNITNINSSTPVTSAVIENADGTIISVNEIITNNINSLLNFQLNKAQLEWLRNNLNQAITLNSILFNNPTNDEKTILINAINDLMNFNINNYPGINEGMPFEWWTDDNFINQNISFNFGEGFKNLTQAEKFLVKFYPVQALKINTNKKIAQDETKRRFTINGINDKSDSFRHAFFNAMNSNDINDFVARLFSNAHESETPNNLILEKQMDLFNNNIGHNIGKSSSLLISNANLSDIIYQNLLDGNLVYLSPINYNDPNFWDNLSTIEPNDGNHGISSLTKITKTNR